MARSYVKIDDIHRIDEVVQGMPAYQDGARACILCKGTNGLFTVYMTIEQAAELVSAMES